MATKLVSMKIDKAERAKMAEPSCMATDAPTYPYGLSLTLDNDALEKLGIAITDLKVGASMTLVATVEVTSVSSRQTDADDDDESAGLQITALCLEDGGTKAKAASAALYPDKE